MIDGMHVAVQIGLPGPPRSGDQSWWTLDTRGRAVITIGPRDPHSVSSIEFDPFHGSTMYRFPTTTDPFYPFDA